ncbi:hypothetical protein LSAT2_026353 [Lamellibrachia satsuma]|nr:hypothetical protein LSAT2_026353 [Lamellibrachia satsuma]
MTLTGVRSVVYLVLLTLQQGGSAVAVWSCSRHPPCLHRHVTPPPQPPESSTSAPKFAANHIDSLSKPLAVSQPQWQCPNLICSLPNLSGDVPTSVEMSQPH